MDTCLLCLEELTHTDKLVQPSKCGCKVYLHFNCLREIEMTGLLCPICRIKNSQKTRIIITRNVCSLLYYAELILAHFIDRPNIISFLLFFMTSIIVSLCMMPYLLFLAIKDNQYRSSAFAFIGSVLFIVYKII